LPIDFAIASLTFETADRESPFTQTTRVALACFGEFYNPRSDHRQYDFIGASETVNVFDCLVVGIGHHLDVCGLKHSRADEWDYRIHDALG
jgi:hypothetical protein